MGRSRRRLAALAVRTVLRRARAVFPILLGWRILDPLQAMLRSIVILALASPAAAQGGEDLHPFLEAYCIRCHGPVKPKAGLALLELGPDDERWVDVLDVLERGEMPPHDEAQPGPAERSSATTWIEGRLAELGSAPAAPTARRLTNAEYRNTLRDLLGIELDVARDLPVDPAVPYRFNNQARTMLLGPEQLDRYLESARRALRSAIVDPTPPEVHRTVRSFEPHPGEFTGLRRDEVGVYGGRRNSAAAAIPIQSWPETGEYRVRIQAAAILPDGYDHAPLRLVMGTELRHDAGTGSFAPVGAVELRNDVDQLAELEFRGRIENHPHQPALVTAKGKQPARMYVYAQNLFDNGELNDHRRSGFDSSWNYATPRVVLRSLEFEAPIYDAWPPAHHTRILFESPLRDEDPPAYVRAVLERFLGRAFRRPATPGELARFERVFATVAPGLTFEAAMRETLAYALVAPQFLLHAHEETGDALASRLSYFLWGSMPDARLLELAASGALHDPEVRADQARRLLADTRAQEALRDFTLQWLSIEKMRVVKVNQSLFPRFLYTYHIGERRGEEVLFRPTIRDYMLEETVAFVAELVRRNASALELVDSDFAMLNEPLAAHYGVEGVTGLALRPVPLEPRDRLGGLLTQGSVLVGNSTGSAPHPIYRAVWLREAILGDEVPAPPAEVPALVDSAGDAATGAVTIKELLQLHRDSDSCRDCHARLDPWGLPFERYSAVGAFAPRVPVAGARVRGFSLAEDDDLSAYAAYLEGVHTVPVDASATLPTGATVDGLGALRGHLLEHRRDQVATNVLRQLVTYGLGRELTARDRAAVEELRAALAADDYRLQDMIVAICGSDLFLGG